MFRNFVSPASLDREGIRPSHPPDSANSHSHPGQQSLPPHQPKDYNQSKYSNHNGIPNGNDPTSAYNGHDTSYDNMKARIVQSTDSTGKGGGFTTSIFVNGGGPNNKKVSVSRAKHSHSAQHVQNSFGKHTPGSYNQNTSTVCPQSPHPGVHSTHAYTPLNSDDIGLAALSITEAEDEQQQQFVPESSLHAQYTPPTVFQNHVAGHLNHKDSRCLPSGIGNLPSRSEEHRNGYTHTGPSLYPIQDEQEEDESYAEVGTSSTDKNDHPQQPFPPRQASPCQAYDQRTFNVIPPPPPSLEQIFVGRRDVRDPRSVSERQIVSAKGTVRGFKNRVKAGIATFWAQPQDQQRNYRLLEQGKIVVYATSMCVVRETSERCKIVRNLLQNYMVRYEERDLYMSREIQQELNHRLSQEGIGNVRLPHVFADGICIGVCI